MKQNIFTTLLFFLSINAPLNAQYYNSVSNRALYYDVYNSTTDKTHRESSCIKQIVTRNDSLFIIQSDFFPPISEQIKDSTLLSRIVQANGNTIIFLKDEKTEINNLKQMVSAITKEDNIDSNKEIVTIGSIQVTINDGIKKGDKIQTDKFILRVGPVSLITTLDGECQGLDVVRTSAGEFNCIKISYKLKVKFLFFSETSRITEWYAKNIGLVKREEYNEKQKSKTIKNFDCYKKSIIRRKQRKFCHRSRLVGFVNPDTYSSRMTHPVERKSRQKKKPLN